MYRSFSTRFRDVQTLKSYAPGGWPTLEKFLVFVCIIQRRVPHPWAFCAQEPALSEAEGVGFHGSQSLGIFQGEDPAARHASR
jgi:hypothetical protein